MKKMLKYQNIVIASHNNGKVLELKNLFSKFSTKIIPAKKLGLSEPKETGETFEENAKIKSSENLGSILLDGLVLIEILP